MFYLRLFGALFSLLTLLGVLFRGLFFWFHKGGYATLDSGDVGYALFWGLRFDFAVAAILALLVVLSALLFAIFRKRKLSLYLSAPLSLTTLGSLMASDIMYFHDAGRHIGYELSDAATDFTSLLGTALTVYWPATLAGTLLTLFWLWIWKSVIPWVRRGEERPLSQVKEALAAFLIVAVSVIALRGGVTNLPMSPLFAYKIGSPKMAEITLNGAYSGVYYLFRSQRKVKSMSIASVEEEGRELNRLKGMYAESIRPESLAFKPMNVVVVLLESWPATLMKGYGFEHDVTPFFDSLATRGITSRGMIAGGHRTTEGIFTTFCSYQNPLGQTLAKSQLGTFTYRSLAQVLREKGWSTSFFQGSRKDTSGTGAFAQRLGFEKSFGKEDIPDGERRFEKNKWGVYDQDIYSFVVKHLKTMEQPFLAGINTNTTHDLSLPKGASPAFGTDSELNTRMSVLRFADDALMEFISAYEKDPDFGPTLFVLLADHTAGVTGSALAHYLIPFTLFATDGSVPQKRVESFLSQRDIAPTVADLLGGHVGTFTGVSMLRDVPRRADYYHQGVLGWIEGDRLVEINILAENSVGFYRLTGVLDEKVKVSPDAIHKRMVKEALAFTRRSQGLLFNGESLSFMEALK